MLKAKSKILLLAFVILTLISSCCFATDELVTLTSDGEEDLVAIPTNDSTAVTTTDITTADMEDITASWTNSDLFVCDTTVNVSNVVDGNAFIIGKDVTISGEIGGDLFVIAEKLNIEGGYIYSSIFALAKEITINGVVYDLYATCDTFNLGVNGFIYRDMKLAASNVNMEGKVRRNAIISSSNINFSEEVGTIIYGNLNYSSNSQVTFPEGSIAGEVKFNEVAVSDEAPSVSVLSIVLTKVLDLIKTLLLTLVVAILLLWLAPNFVKKLANMSVGKSFACLGIGFVAPIALVMIGILLLIISVGSGIFLSGLFGFIFIASIANAVASLFFGKLFAKLLKLEGNVKLILMTLASSLVIWAINLLPIVGSLLTSLISLFGLGAIIVNIVYNKTKKEEVKE